MATQIPDQFPIQFDTSFMSEYQQKGSRLAALAGVVKPGKGEFIRFNKILKRTAHEITERGGDTIYANDSFENRILFPRAAEDAVLRPEFDMASLEDIVLPNSQEVQEMAQAIGRIEDSFVISALTGSTYEGTTSPSVVPYDSNQAIAVNFGGSSVGLTYQKVSQAKYMFEKNEVDDGSLYLLVSAKQMQDLRNDIIANHADDYSSYTAAQAGDLKSLFGFQFVRTELLSRPRRSPKRRGTTARRTWITSRRSATRWLSAPASVPAMPVSGTRALLPSRAMNPPDKLLNSNNLTTN